MTTRDDWERSIELTRLFIAAQLGPKPRRVAAQDAAIAYASDVLDSLTSDEAAMARRVLAIEYVALTSGQRGRPRLTDWEAAIGTVDGSADADVRRMARGGMYLRAASGGWADKAGRAAKSVERLAAHRTPGLDGTYSGTCVACLRPTDTALGVQGVPEWQAGVLVALGLPDKEAVALVAEFLDATGEGPGPDGRYERVYRVCGDCAARVPHFPRPTLALPGEPVPTIGQP